jgi:hypothetical protein
MLAQAILEGVLRDKVCPQPLLYFVSVVWLGFKVLAGNRYAC